ncbi:hypothetical protein H0H93_007172 [Arthromyces matolae]|nr:hypothetical protein H0H93_007172 [Arthromyces matolae]
MHADHIMGIVPFLRNILWPPPLTPTDNGPRIAKPKKPKIEIYGPTGIRNFVRQIMKMTLTKTSDFYVVHELLKENDPITPCLPHDEADNTIHLPDVMHYNEIAGQDIQCTEDGFWKAFVASEGAYGEICVDAGPILHRDPCIGYVVREKTGPMRKVVILGDTYDPSAMIPLCILPSPSLLIHEATDAHIPLHVDYNARRSPDTVLATALGRGHSIPTMAGEFAKTIGAERLVLNHIGSRYGHLYTLFQADFEPVIGLLDRFPAPRFENDHRSAVISEIERQATEAWGSGTRAIAAYDYLTVKVPVTNPMRDDDSAACMTDGYSVHVSTDVEPSGSMRTVTMSAHRADPSRGFRIARKTRKQGSSDWGRDDNRDRKKRR